MWGLLVALFLYGAGLTTSWVVLRLRRNDVESCPAYAMQCTSGHETMVRIDLYTTPGFVPSDLHCAICGCQIFEVHEFHE
jgi:hypothetical protein